MPRHADWVRGKHVISGYMKRINYIKKRKRKYKDKTYTEYYVEVYIPQDFSDKPIYVVVEDGKNGEE